MTADISFMEAKQEGCDTVEESTKQTSKLPGIKQCMEG